jgi:hypothetical protein
MPSNAKPTDNKKDAVKPANMDKSKSPDKNNKGPAAAGGAKDKKKDGK